MSSQISLSMNSSRPYESFVEKQNINKENNNQPEKDKDKEEKLKELLEKNERLEKECLKFQIQVKSLEVKLQTFKEKEYKSQNNTSSNFLLPSEFRKVWEDFGKESVGDIFVDFFDDFILTLNLFQEIMLISHLHFKEELKNLTNKIMKILEIKNINKSYSFIEKNIKPIILEYYEDIFENESKSDFFYLKIKEDYAKFINENFLNDEGKESNKKIRDVMKTDKTDELRELLRSNYIKDFLKTVKKIFLFVEFHEPQLNLKLESFEDRKQIVREMKQSDCVLADGYIKDVKNCLILLDPPLLKNGYPYSGLKPIALICPDDFKGDQINTNNNLNEININNSNENLEELLVSASRPKIEIIDIDKKTEFLNAERIENGINNEDKDKDIFIPLKKEDKFSISTRSKLSDIEKKEKIIQMILDNDKDNDTGYNNNNNNNFNGSIGFVNLNKDLVNNKKNDYEIVNNKAYKNFDVAFSRNPNTSSSRDFSRSDSKIYIHPNAPEAEKQYNNNENNFDNKSLLENKNNEKSSEEFLEDKNQEGKTVLDSLRERNINLEKTSFMPSNKSNTNSSRNLIINSNPFTSNNTLNANNYNNKIKSNLNNVINISVNSDLKTGNLNNNNNNSFIKNNNNNNNNNNNSNYSINSNNMQNCNEVSLNGNNKINNKPNIIKISKGFNPENNLVSNKTNNNKDLSSPLLKVSENSQSLKNLNLIHQSNMLTRNQLGSKGKLNEENSKTVFADRKELNLIRTNDTLNLNPLNNEKLEIPNAPKEGFIRGINIINITNKIKENENLNNSNNNIRKNSNDSLRNASNERGLKAGDLSKTSSKNALDKQIQILNNINNSNKINTNDNNNSNINASLNSNNIQSVQQFKINLNRTEDLKIQNKTSPVHRGNIISTKNATVTSIDLSKMKNNTNSNSKESKKIIEAFNSNNNNLIANNNTNNNNINNNFITNNVNQHHKTLKKKPHEVQLTLTNQNFNYISTNNDLNFVASDKKNNHLKNTKTKNNDSNQKNEDSDSASGDFKKIKSRVGKQNPKKIRASELSQNYRENENLNDLSKKSQGNSSYNNKSYASNSNSILYNNKFPKTRSTSEHQLSNKVNDLYTHSYSYSYINLNRLNILSSKKSGSNSTSVNDSCRVGNKRKSEGSSNIFINNNFKNYNNNFKEQANSSNKASSANHKDDANSVNKYSNNNLYEINSDSAKLTNKPQNNYYNHIKFNRDSYKNRYAYLNSNNKSNSKTKNDNNNNNNLNSNSEKGRINLLNKNPSAGKLGNLMVSSAKNDRYSNSSNNCFNNLSSGNNYNHMKKIYSKNNSNDFNYINSNNNINNNNINNCLASNLNKTNSKNNFFNTSKEKDNYSINTNNEQHKEKHSNGTGAFSIRSYTNEYKSNLSKKEKTLLNSKEKILNINKIFKNKNAISNSISNNERLEMPSSRTQANMESAELTKYEKSTLLDIHKISKLQMNFKSNYNYNDNNQITYIADAEKEIVFNDYFENPHLETEGDECDFNKESQKNFFSNSFTFKKEKKKLSLSCEKAQSSQKRLHLALLKTKKPKGDGSQSKDRLSNNTQQNTLINENKSTVTDYSNVQTKRESLRSNVKKNSIKKSQVSIANLNVNNNNLISKDSKKLSSITELVSGRNKISSKNIHDLNSSKNNYVSSINNFNLNEKANEIYLNSNSSENPTAVLTSNFIAKSNLNSNSKNVITSNRNESKTKVFIEKKFNNISGQQTNIANLNITKEKILDFNNLNANPANALINHPAHTPNHNYNKSTHTHISYLTNLKNNNEKVANKITQILSMQNKKSASIKRNQSRTPNNNAKNHSSKLKGYSPKVKGVINLNNESISNSIVNNTNVHINLNLKNFDNNGNLYKENYNNDNKNNDDLNASLERNILVTHNSRDSIEKSIVNNNLIKNEEFEVLSSTNYRNNNGNYNPNQQMKSYNPATVNRNVSNNVYSTIKKLSSQEPEELNINRTLNSINNSKSKEKNKRYNLNFNKYHHITKEKLKSMKKDKFVKYPTLKERSNNDYMLLKDEFSYYDNLEINNNSINIPDNNLIENNKNYINNYDQNKIYNKSSNINKTNLSKKSDFNYNNNYIHTTDDEEIIEYNNDSKIFNHGINFLNENSVDFTNEDLNIIQFSDKKIRDNNNNNNKGNDQRKYQTAYVIESENQEYNSPNMLIEEKDFDNEALNLHYNNIINKNENKYEEEFLETNNSISTINLGADANFKKDLNSNRANKNFRSINVLKKLTKISPVQKETIETCDGIYISNETIQNMKISDFNLNSNYKSSNLENITLYNQVLSNNLNHKKSQKSNSRPNNIKEILSGNSNNNNNNNTNTEASGSNFNKSSDKLIKNSNVNAPLTQVGNMHHNNKEKNASKNSNHIKSNNSKEIFLINSGKKISPVIDKKAYESNVNNKPNNLNLKFNYIDLASKNNGNNYTKKINAGQFINTNTASKEKLNDKPKHNFININYTK